MNTHITIQAIVYTVFGAFGILASLIMIFIITSGGSHSIYIDSMFGNSELVKIFPWIWLIVSIPAFIGGLGMFKRMEWARITILVVAAIQLFNFPFGTGITIYTFWTLLNEEAKNCFH